MACQEIGRPLTDAMTATDPAARNSGVFKNAFSAAIEKQVVIEAIKDGTSSREVAELVEAVDAYVATLGPLVEKADEDPGLPWENPWTAVEALDRVDEACRNPALQNPPIPE